jgi:hypothetical protein
VLQRQRNVQYPKCGDLYANVRKNYKHSQITPENEMQQEGYHSEHQYALQYASLGEAQSGPIRYKNVKETHQAHRADSVVSANCHGGKGQSRCD